MADSTGPLVRHAVRDGVAIVELDRPHRKNAIVGPLLDELAAAFDAVSADAAVQSVLLGGAGGSFCSGLDLTEYRAEPPPPWLPTAGDSLRAAHAAIAACPHPVVVALERYAINGGAAFALAGDLIIVGRTAWLQVGEVRLGMDAPMNLAWLLARHSVATALQLVLSGDRVAGSDLLRLGIAHEVVDDDLVRSRAHELAATIAAFPPGAARRLKAAAIGLAAEPSSSPLRTSAGRTTR
jgi:enoyl-CoA hydratase